MGEIILFLDAGFGVALDCNVAYYIVVLCRIVSCRRSCAGLAVCTGSIPRKRTGWLDRWMDEEVLHMSSLSIVSCGIVSMLSYRITLLCRTTGSWQPGLDKS